MNFSNHIPYGFCDSLNAERQANVEALASQRNLIPIGTRIRWNFAENGGREFGTIVRYNESLSAFYGASRYPYVIRWDNDGYQDVYDSSNFSVVI